MISNINTLHKQMPLFSSENQSYVGSLGLKVLLLPSLAGRSSSPWPSYHFLHGEMCSVRGSGNAFLQTPSCGCERHAQSRWCPLHGYGCEEPGFSNSGTSALGSCQIALHCQGRATPRHALKQHFRRLWQDKVGKEMEATPEIRNFLA